VQKIKEMKEELEALEEHRDVLEKASEVIFARKPQTDNKKDQLKDFMKGDTKEIANFLEKRES